MTKELAYALGSGSYSRGQLRLLGHWLCLIPARTGESQVVDLATTAMLSALQAHLTGSETNDRICGQKYVAALGSLQAAVAMNNSSESDNVFCAIALLMLMNVCKAALKLERVANSLQFAVRVSVVDERAHFTGLTAMVADKQSTTDSASLMSTIHYSGFLPEVSISLSYFQTAT